MFYIAIPPNTFKFVGNFVTNVTSSKSYVITNVNNIGLS